MWRVWSQVWRQLVNRRVFPRLITVTGQYPLVVVTSQPSSQNANLRPGVGTLIQSGDHTAAGRDREPRAHSRISVYRNACRYRPFNPSSDVRRIDGGVPQSGLSFHLD